MRRLLVPLIVLVLLAGCTQAPGTTDQQKQPGADQQGQSQPQLPQIGGAPVNVAAQLAELGVPISGNSKAVSVKSKYSISVAGQDCKVELSYDMSTCSASEPTKSGNQYSFCQPPYQYSLTSSCDVVLLASQLKANPKIDGKKFTTDVWIPWYDKATDVSISLVLDKAPGIVTYFYATGDYQYSYPSSGTYLMFKDPANYIIVQGGNADGILSDIRNVVGSNEYEPSENILNYIPSDWYGTGLVPRVCYNPYGLLTADPGQFNWKENILNAKSDPVRKLVSPASFVFGPVSPYLGGKQLEAMGQPIDRIEDYQAHYKLCKVYTCYEGCNKDNVLVLTKGDCSIVTASPSSKPPISSEFSTILEIVKGLKTFSGINDYICFGILDSKAESIFLGDYKTGRGIIYARPVIVDHAVELFITDSSADPKEFLQYLINNKLSSTEYSLRADSSSGPCQLYTWGSPNDFTGYAGHCSESNGLKLLFFNICTQAEDCNPSARAFFSQVTQ